MSHNFDFLNSVILLGLAATASVIYLARTLIRGKAHYSRVEKQGSSALLSKDVMEGTYWTLQPIAKLLIVFGVTANAISWASLVTGLLAGMCLAFGHFGFGAVFSTVSALMDALDGLVARLTGTSSDAGEVLDATIDRYNEFFFLGGLIIYYREIPVLVLLCLLALLGSFMVSYSTAKAEALGVTPPKGVMRRPERAIYLTLGAALSPLTIPLWETYRNFTVPVGHPMVLALCLIAVLANFSAVERMIAIAKAVKQKALDSGKSPVPAMPSHDSDSQAHPASAKNR